MNTNLLSGLYYPFSMPKDPTPLKQMLLVFDSITFLEPVSDDELRAEKFREMQGRDDTRYVNYEGIHASRRSLAASGAVILVSPASLPQIQDPAVTASAISDLRDPQWMEIADPRSYGMSYQHFAQDHVPTWHTLRSKLPEAFIRLITDAPDYRRHLVQAGEGDTKSWKFTYAAGSAAALNVHLAAAQALGLAPVTDSPLHHDLLLRKLARNSGDHGVTRPQTVVAQLANRVTIDVVKRVIPTQALSQIGFDEILTFREETSVLRKQFLEDVSLRISRLLPMDDATAGLRIASEIEFEIAAEFRKFEAELKHHRDVHWPNLVDSVNKALVPGSAAALAMNYIAGPGHVMAASITALGAAAINVSLAEMRRHAEIKNLQLMTSPSISYLWRLKKV